jgi:photosystem II stability/assembly factor-like uncharacterized protein
MGWGAVNVGFPQDVSVESLAIDPRSPSVVYAGASPSWSEGPFPTCAPCGGIFQSIDGGATWASVDGAFLEGWNVQLLAIDPTYPSTIYAVDPVGHDPLNRRDAGMMAKSSDGGATWTTILGSFGSRIDSMAMDPLSPTTLYAGELQDFGPAYLLKSLDAGETWDMVLFPSARQGPTFFDPSALAVDPRVPTTIYAGTYDGVFQSVDGGATWASMSEGLTDLVVSALVVDPTGTTLYAGTNGGGVYTREISDDSMTTTTTTSSTTMPPCTTARCILDGGLMSAMCVEQRVPANVTGKFDRAVGLLDRATTSSGKQARKLRKRARNALKQAEAKALRAAKRKKHTISSNCAMALKAAAEQVVGGLGV